MNNTAKRFNSDVLTTSIELAGKRVVDIGCGDGSMVRLMTRHGAKVFGIEPNAQQLEKAHAEKPAGDEIYHQGGAEDLPFEDDSIDVAVFFNSLHHIPADSMAMALKEALRVLKAGGILFVSEPLAEGSHFDLMQPVHDETQVRALAQKTLANAPGFGFEKVEAVHHTHPVRMTDFETFRDRMLRINPNREADFNAKTDELKKRFSDLGAPVGDGFEFDQPMQVDIFQKT